MIVKSTTFQEYLNGVPPERHAALKKLRALVRKAVPAVREHFRYGMPGYELAGEAFFGFAAQKGYLAVYVCPVRLIPKYRPRLGTRDCGKSCLRYRGTAEPPFEVLAELLGEAASLMKSARSVKPAAPAVVRRTCP